MPRPGMFAAFLAALALLPLGACGSHSGAADAGPTAGAEPLTPVPAPAGLLAEIVVPAPGATWAKVRGSAGGPAVFFPQSLGGLVTTLVGLPITMAAEIDDAVPVVGAALREGKGPAVLTLGVHVKAGDRFVDQLTRGEGARCTAVVDPASHVTLLTDKVAPGSARVAIGVLGNYLLVGQKPADLYALGPYVARTLSVAPVPKEEIAVELPSAALAGPIADAVRDLHGSSEGRIAALLPLGDVLDTTAAVLADATHARVTLALDPGAVHARLTVSPRPGNGPGARLVAELPAGDLKPLLALPDSTLGLLWRESAATRTESAPRHADALAKLLGKGVTPEERDAMGGALRAEAEARGDWTAVGLAFNGTGQTMVWRAPVADADRMKKALKQIVALGSLASFKQALAGLGLKLSAEKAVVENLAADVTRVHLARDLPSRDGKRAAPPKDDPQAIDLLYLVDNEGIFAAAGYDPKESLRALVKPAGHDLASNGPMAAALAAVGPDAAFVLVADALRIDAMTSGTVPPAAPTPLLLAAGRTTAPAELWARADVPIAVLQQLVTEYTRRRTAPPPPAPTP